MFSLLVIVDVFTAPQLNRDEEKVASRMKVAFAAMVAGIAAKVAKMIA